MEEIQEKYFEYLKQRGKNTEERLHLKADLAEMVAKGEGGWYLKRLEKPSKVFPGMTYGGDKTKGVEIVEENEKREPSLAESVMATQDLSKDYQQVKEILLPRSRAIIRLGSSDWAENYDVRFDPTDPSDLDIEVFMDEVDPSIGEGIPGAVEALTEFKKYFDKGEADYLSFGFKHNGRPTSIHFMPVKTFERNCNIDCEHITEPILAKEFRMKAKSKAPIYDERYDGEGREYIFEAKPYLVEGGQITEVPVMMIGEDKKLVMGLVMSKYFGFPRVDGDSKFFGENVELFKTGVAKRLKKEGGSFSNMPGRKARMPYHIKERLDKEQELLMNK